MKKIVLLADQMHSHGGIEKLVAIKANYWADIFNYNITILTTEQENKKLLYNLSEKVKHIDFNINYNRNKSFFSFINLLKLIKNILKIQFFLIKHSPDFVIVASHIPITYILPFLFFRGKMYKEFHFSKYDATNTGLKNKLMNFVESKYDKLIVLSEEEKNFYLTKNLTVIPNPISNKNTFSEINIDENEKIAFFVGRIAPVKQIEKLISIWEKFFYHDNSWKLYIFGNINNEFYAKLNEIVEEKKLDECIFFKGDSNQIQKELSKGKILLMTSKHECFPMVILESFSVGIPVISFDCPTGPRNIIENNKTGILVKHNDENQFVAELLKYGNDILFQKNLSKNAQISAKNYNLDKIMNSWKTLFENDEKINK